MVVWGLRAVAVGLGDLKAMARVGRMVGLQRSRGVGFFGLWQEDVVVGWRQVRWWLDGGGAGKWWWW